METEHKLQMDAQNTNNLKQITALRMELQRAVELRKQKVGPVYSLPVVAHIQNVMCLGKPRQSLH